jgi:hypothetical protein
MNVKVFIGVVCSGKDYAARQTGGLKIAFADKLREMVWKLIGWKPKNDDEYEFFKGSTFLSKNISFTGRELLERFGTEVIRDLDPDFWVSTVEQKILKAHKEGKVETICITDARFVNEIEMLMLLNGYRGISVDFIFTNYKSYRYDPNRTHSCEKLAQLFLKKGYQHMQSLNTAIYSGKWKDCLK